MLHPSRSVAGGLSVRFQLLDLADNLVIARYPQFLANFTEQVFGPGDAMNRLDQFREFILNMVSNFGIALAAFLKRRFGIVGHELPDRTPVVPYFGHQVILHLAKRSRGLLGSPEDRLQMLVDRLGRASGLRLLHDQSIEHSFLLGREIIDRVPESTLERSNRIGHLALIRVDGERDRQLKGNPGSLGRSQGNEQKRILAGRLQDGLTI